MYVTKAHGCWALERVRSKDEDPVRDPVHGAVKAAVHIVA